MDKPQLDKLRINPILIGVSLLFCFPVGLFLVWGHPSWSQRQKWQWTGVWAGIMFLFMIVASMQDAATKKTLAEADQLWTAGQKTEAVAKYKSVIKNSVSGIDESKRPVVFQRVIESDMEQGNVTEAKAMVEKALDSRVSVSFERTDAKNLNAQVQAERETKKVAGGGKKDDEYGWDSPEKNPKGSKTNGEKATASSMYDSGFKEGLTLGQTLVKQNSRSIAEKLAQEVVPSLEVDYRKLKELADSSGNTGYLLEAQRKKGFLDGYRKALRDGGITVR